VSDRPADLRHPVREERGGAEEQSSRSSVRTAVRDALKTTGLQLCDPCAGSAFQAWRDQHLTPSYNYFVDFSSWNLVPTGKRAVIELVTAEIVVPDGEWARLRMYTSLGSTPGNFDLTLKKQGVTGGRQIFVSTHALRVYTDHTIEFNVNRDNANTEGDAFIAISGHIADS
jgi:hypothetical protein